MEKEIKCILKDSYKGEMILSYIRKIENALNLVCDKHEEIERTWHMGYCNKENTSEKLKEWALKKAENM